MRRGRQQQQQRHALTCCPSPQQATCFAALRTRFCRLCSCRTRRTLGTISRPQQLKCPFFCDGARDGTPLGAAAADAYSTTAAPPKNVHCLATAPLLLCRKAARLNCNAGLRQHVPFGGSHGMHAGSSPIDDTPTASCLQGCSRWNRGTSRKLMNSLNRNVVVIGFQIQWAGL